MYSEVDSWWLMLDAEKICYEGRPDGLMLVAISRLRWRKNDVLTLVEPINGEVEYFGLWMVVGS